MTAEIYIAGYTDIDFSPQTLTQEVAQNIRSIITTPKGSVPMFREFGLSENLTDSPVNEAAAKIKAEIIMAVRKYEPRAKIKSINFEADNSGRLGVRITFTLQKEVLP